MDSIQSVSQTLARPFSEQSQPLARGFIPSLSNAKILFQASEIRLTQLFADLNSEPPALNRPEFHPPIELPVQIPYPKRLKKIVRKRRRGTAIVDTPAGVLIVAGKSGRFSLPGGAAERGESRKAATVRELEEETTLKALSVQYLFSYTAQIRWRKTGWVRDQHKVFLVQAQGTPQPTHEIRELRFYQPGDPVRMAEAARIIIDRYWLLKQQGLEGKSAGA